MDVNKFVFPLNNIFPAEVYPDETGLVALGGKLNTMSLIEAYSKGIFPWAGNHPIPWYSPDPRLILVPTEFCVSKSLSKLIKKNQFKVYYDQNFKQVIQTCSEIKRRHQRGTWIDKNIIREYEKLFEFNIAHCIEVYQDDTLMGGLYGLSLGNIFFGESMFSIEPNGSKIALYYLTRKLISLNFSLIDCQQSTPHLKSLGAKEISRKEFLNIIKDALFNGIDSKKWTE